MFLFTAQHFVTQAAPAPGNGQITVYKGGRDGQPMSNLGELGGNLAALARNLSIVGIIFDDDANSNASKISEESSELSNPTVSVEANPNPVQKLQPTKATVIPKDDAESVVKKQDASKAITSTVNAKNQTKSEPSQVRVETQDIIIDIVVDRPVVSKPDNSTLEKVKPTPLPTGNIEEVDVKSKSEPTPKTLKDDVIPKSESTAKFANTDVNSKPSAKAVETKIKTIPKHMVSPVEIDVKSQPSTKPVEVRVKTNPKPSVSPVEVGVKSQPSPTPVEVKRTSPKPKVSPVDVDVKSQSSPIVGPIYAPNELLRQPVAVTQSVPWWQYSITVLEPLVLQPIQVHYIQPQTIAPSAQ